MIPDTINDDTEVSLRARIFEYAASRAEGPLKPYLERLYQRWHQFNAEHFASRLTPALILVSPPSSARAVGDYSVWSGYGGKVQIRLRPTVIDGTFGKFNPNHRIEDRWLWIEDILLHEMVHQWQIEIIGHASGNGGHNADYARVANEIGDKIGLLGPVVWRRRKDKSVPIASDWPDCVRPPGYYGTLFKAPGEPEQDADGEEQEPDLLGQTLKAYRRLTPNEQQTFRAIINDDSRERVAPAKPIRLDIRRAA